jgi:type II secretory pathway pseudopilin PulG
MGLVRPERRGITLLEVLISIGILAIGLSSVVALVPAGRSQASRAVLLDRAANLAANALADAATFGLLRPECLVPTQSGAAPIVVDAVDAPMTPVSLALAGGTTVASASLRNEGIFTMSGAAGAAPAAVHRLFTQSRDDVIVRLPASPDDPSSNLFVADARAFEGRLSCLLLITGTSALSQMGRVSVVVFHGRDPTTTAVTGTISKLQLTIPPAALGGRSFRDVVKPGVIVWEPGATRFHQLSSAAVDTSGTSAFVTLSPGGMSFSGDVPVTVLPDSVGFAERPYVPETIGSYTQ